MKKVYEKPAIVFESFTMSANIAGDCEKIVGNPSKGSCGVKGSVDGLDLFIEGVTGCIIQNSTDDHDGFCYHNPTEYNNLFNS